MKCFSVFFLITSVALAEIVVRPLGQAKITTGDIVEVFIEAETIPDLSGETIGNIFYVLEQREQNLKVLVAPVQRDNSKSTNDSNEFKLVGFEFDHKQVNPPKNFIIEDKEYDLTNEVENWKLVLFAIISLVLGIFGFKFILKKTEERRRRRELRIRAENALSETQGIKTRTEIEDFYRNRNEFAKLLDWGQKEYSSFVYTLNTHQYKQSWSEADESEVNQKFLLLKKSMSVKSGI